jgi:hypothetical protein
MKHVPTASQNQTARELEAVMKNDIHTKNSSKSNSLKQNISKPGPWLQQQR